MTRLLSDSTVSWSYGKGQTTSYYKITSIVFSTFSSVSYVFTCAEGTSTNSKNVGITRFTLSGTYTVSSSAAYLDSTSSYTAYCKGIYASSQNSIYNIIYYSNGDIHYTFTDLSVNKIYHTPLTAFSGTDTVINNAYFID